QSLKVSKADFSFRLADFDSEHKARDEKMNKWIESDKFPKISFSLTDVKTVNGGSVGIGKLSMHGVSKEVEVPFTVTREGNTVSIDGTAAFSYEDWNLEIIRLFLFRVRPELNVQFHLKGVISGS
ncbi:MAG: YceI family protein, partial [Verrucomicrobiae bacterium]|nr:YceI family protein [Verrucomicrobiae bacterium]